MPGDLMVSRYAIVCDGTVINVVLWDGQTEWTPDEGCTLHKLPDDSPVGSGWGRTGNNRWTPPNDAEQGPQPVTLTVDPVALTALLQTIAEPDFDPKQAIADFVNALTPNSAAPG